ncbi:MAG: polyprenyl synthetase family protein [Bacteroidales bacterium]|nr:polyprenyl synthetase family protein [Bacteroidales bacterium]
MDKPQVYNSIRNCIAEELEDFDHLFESVLRTRVPLADSVIHYFLERNGKQLRPILTLLSAKMLGKVNEATIYGAAALDLLHNATLMHDDVVDQSATRRGRDTINNIWDNRIAVLMGDFFLSKCLNCSNATGSLRISCVLADMVTMLVEGELEQISNVRTHLLSEDAYFSVIRGKTASLFAACMRVGALSVGASADVEERMAKVGELMGMVFQIRDDIFDYYPSTKEVGKPTGHDIMEGKITLPLLYAFQHAPADEAARMKAIVEQSQMLTGCQVAQLVEFAKSIGGIEYAQAKMKNISYEAKKLLSTFPESDARGAIMSLIDYFSDRNY